VRPALARAYAVDMTDDALRDIPFTTADGSTATLADYGGKVLLIVNVASKCGLTPQYEQLEQLQRTYGDRGFTVLGFPCNQFMGQEPGTMDEILEFCSTSYGVTFPVLDKVKVNGTGAAPLFKALKKTKDAEGKRGPIMWNFEKFVLTPDGVLHRFRPQTKPDDPAVVAVIEEALPA
jgi:glutathione peroxidase